MIQASLGLAGSRARRVAFTTAVSPALSSQRLSPLPCLHKLSASETQRDRRSLISAAEPGGGRLQLVAEP
ncbi:hypothetical protein RRG08_064853 [Elysia crispata]|uniref:Uncharacterized protein n=1 Tax=Elysia crispata TaxID=231223 RepID=A0AAE1DRC3_9GAST|nr:hypothetical protein RRG08_064853 [Elysia crispata]